MKKILYTTLIILAAGSTVFAQNMVDALRLSDVRLQGTARATAMGNAFGALGGDFTSASINPAGLGLYRSNEFVFTTQFGEAKYDASYLGASASDSKFNVSVPSIGYVVNFPSASNSTSSLVSFSLGLGYNRMNNFNVKKLVMGRGATSSMLDQFVVNADGSTVGNLDPFYEALAAYDPSDDYGTDLIYYYDSDPNKIYYHDMLVYQADDPSNLENFAHDQRKSFSQKGSVDEYTISFAANFNHKVYLGATIGIHDVYFKETTTLNEYNIDYEGNNDFNRYLNEYSFNSYLRTTGSGFNFKIGAIFKPVDQLRIGLAFHSPTFYDLHDSYDNSMYSDIDYITDDGSYINYKTTAYSPYGDYDYQMETPMKGIVSAAYVIGKSGLISVDYEYVDYGSMKLRDGGDGYDFYDENQDIKEAFKSVGNLRVGGEYRVNNFFSLRGGYEYFPSPYKSVAFGTDQMNSDANTSTYSAGFGLKSGGFFFDAAYKYMTSTSYMELYQVPDGVSSPMAKMDYTNNNITFTLGFRF
ncbi:OmpP1/FadL family transporter [Mangrovibacterium diazotrophicum]|uniref:Outer membrane protein transport protein (OMPP1/FadL/TodX) n=1 Tax=Mangrovibacterium diazotrophicum TaxID=1261403 RepID=A0A419W513_9BACT|nr:outer membrane protein transport protein [Mangrovibacterium diazotrophicum]RKD90525.1 outer membrane protein transport protein (OMPP1/FadL/TodX) [Mangrovibacterium diazotrophicum]